MCRLLRPGGRAVIGIEWNAEDGKDHSKEAKKHGYHIWTEGELRAMMKEAGFSEVFITYAKGLMMPKMMIASGVKPWKATILGFVRQHLLKLFKAS
jgi:hypothetical protein